MYLSIGAVCSTQPLGLISFEQYLGYIYFTLDGRPIEVCTLAVSCYDIDSLFNCGLASMRMCRTQALTPASQVHSCTDFLI